MTTHASATIGVVDDDSSVRMALRQLLRAAGYEPLTFESAEGFLTSRSRDQVECLIVDVNLPGVSGVALLKRLSEDGVATPAVLMTARDDPLTLELIRQAAPVPHLRKPFSDQELFAAIGQVLRA